MPEIKLHKRIVLYSILRYYYNLSGILREWWSIHSKLPFLLRFLRHHNPPTDRLYYVRKDHELLGLDQQPPILHFERPHISIKLNFKCYNRTTWDYNVVQMYWQIFNDLVICQISILFGARSFLSGTIGWTSDLMSIRIYELVWSTICWYTKNKLITTCTLFNVEFDSCVLEEIRNVILYQFVLLSWVDLNFE